MRQWIDLTARSQGKQALEEPINDRLLQLRVGPQRKRITIRPS
jgi:hypothetical protein